MCMACQEDKVQGLDQHYSAELERSMYQLEMERLRYLLASYIRTRLKKVCCSVWSQADQSGHQNFLIDSLCDACVATAAHSLAWLWAGTCEGCRLHMIKF